MEPYGSVPMFLDEDRGPGRYLLTHQMCRELIAQDKAEPSSTSEDTLNAGNPLVSISRPQTSSDTQASMSNQFQPLATQDESNSEDKTQPTGTRSPSLRGGDSALAPVARRIRCPECHRYTAETEEKMLRHIKKVHKGENPFQCYMCDYSTYNKSLFEEHVRIHQGIKPFQCPQCDYKSASKKNLKKHELIHRPNNPLKCQECDFIARHSKALKRHQEIHSGNDWLKFDSCKFQFQNIDAFEKHERTHKFKCKECDFKSCSRPFLKRHMVKEHGADDVVKKESFCCQICGWNSSTVTKILLHLIHHPKQEVDETVIDVSILRKHGIMT